MLAQLEGSGRGALAAYNKQQYAVLSRQLQEGSLRDPDAWMAELLRQDKGIGGCGGLVGVGGWWMLGWGSSVVHLLMRIRDT